MELALDPFAPSAADHRQANNEQQDRTNDEWAREVSRVAESRAALSLFIGVEIVEIVGDRRTRSDD